MDMPAPHFLFPVRGEFLRLYAFSSFHKARLSADSLLFAFPRAVRDAQVSMPSPNSAGLGQLSAHAH